MGSRRCHVEFLLSFLGADCRGGILDRVFDLMGKHHRSMGRHRIITLERDGTPGHPRVGWSLNFVPLRRRCESGPAEGRVVSFGIPMRHFSPTQLGSRHARRPSRCRSAADSSPRWGRRHHHGGRVHTEAALNRAIRFGSQQALTSKDMLILEAASPDALRPFPLAGSHRPLLRGRFITMEREGAPAPTASRQIVSDDRNTWIPM